MEEEEIDFAFLSSQGEADTPQPVTKEKEPLQGDDKVYLSAIWSRSRLGVAIYEAASNSMRVAQTPVKYQVRPYLILTDYSADGNFKEALGEPCVADDKLSVSKLSFQRSRYSKYQHARIRLLLLRVAELPYQENSQDAYAQLTSVIDFSAVEVIRAAGALVSYLDQNQILPTGTSAGGSETETTAHLTSLRSFVIDGTLTVDPVTSQALQIFNNERHPSLTGIGATTEGLSLFSILDKTRSVAGRQLLRISMQRPILDRAAIEDRLSSIEWLIKPEQQGLLSESRSLIRCVSDIQKLAIDIQTATVVTRGWRVLAESMSHTLRLTELVRTKFNQTLTIYGKVNAIDDQAIGAALRLLGLTIDIQSSSVGERPEIQPGISEQLDQLKENYENLGDFLTAMASEDLEKLPVQSIKSMNMVYYPQVGFLAAFDADLAAVEIEGYELQFKTHEHAFFKNKKARELDDNIGDIQGQIADLECAILNELCVEVLKAVPDMLYAVTAIAELDVLCSFAISAQECNYVRPKIAETGCIQVKNGRHPVQELLLPAFVPNDTAMVAGKQSGTVIITGPNQSGKSAYLKQLGLIVFMAHLGSFVPADEATISLADRIYTRVHTMQSVVSGLSTFMIDAQQVSVMLRSMTSRSLLLVDEFGKGTAPTGVQPTDGIALVASLVKYLTDMGPRAPHACIVTHFTEALSKELVPELLSKSTWLSMSVTVSPQFGRETNSPSGEEAQAALSNVAEKIVFLYKLIPGRKTTAHAAQVALASGVDVDLVERAVFVANQLADGKEVPPPEKAWSNDVDLDAMLQEFMQLDCDKGDVRTFLDKHTQASRLPSST